MAGNTFTTAADSTKQEDRGWGKGVKHKPPSRAASQASRQRPAITRPRARLEGVHKDVIFQGLVKATSTMPFKHNPKAARPTVGEAKSAIAAVSKAATTAACNKGELRALAHNSAGV